MFVGFILMKILHAVLATSFSAFNVFSFFLSSFIATLCIDFTEMSMQVIVYWAVGMSAVPEWGLNPGVPAHTSCLLRIFFSFFFEGHPYVMQF